MEISNLSNAEFITLVIRILKELIEYRKNIRKEMNVTLSEIKKNLQGTNSGGDEAKIQINDLEYKEEIIVEPEQQEEKRSLKNENSLRSPWDDFRHTNIHIMGMPEGEKKRPRN